MRVDETAHWNSGDNSIDPSKLFSYIFYAKWRILLKVTVKILMKSSLTVATSVYFSFSALLPCVLIKKKLNPNFEQTDE